MQVSSTFVSAYPVSARFLAVMLRPQPPPACKKPRTNINQPVPRSAINRQVRSLIKKRAASAMSPPRGTASAVTLLTPSEW